MTAWWRGSGSPGLQGYVLAYVASAPLAVLPVAGSALVDDGWSSLGDRVGALLGLMVVGTIFALLYGAPAGLLGTLAVHVALLRVRQQWLHVLAFVVVGCLAGLAYDRVLFGGGPFLVWALGLATGLARLAVVPLARARQR